MASFRTQFRETQIEEPDAGHLRVRFCKERRPVAGVYLMPPTKTPTVSGDVYGEGAPDYADFIASSATESGLRVRACTQSARAFEG